jgi:tripartite-type tricarboxylate transporter receptor subunit TctC
MKKILILLLVVLSPLCYSQTTIIVPSGAGGSVDSLARKFAKFAELKTSKTFVVENVSGAGGSIGVSRFLKSRPNSLMITSSSWYLSIINNEFSLVDFKPVAVLAEAPFFLITNKSQQLTCERLRTSKSHYFLGNGGGVTEIVSTVISSKYPNIENIPYKSVKQSTVDLYGNQINATIITSTNDIIDPLVPLANTTSRTVNGVPSFAECLKIKTDLTGNFILITNATSDSAFIENTQTLASEFVKDPETQNYYKENSFYKSAADFKSITAMVDSQLKNWKKVIK